MQLFTTIFLLEFGQICQLFINIWSQPQILVLHVKSFPTRYSNQYVGAFLEIITNMSAVCWRNPFLMLQSWDWAQMKALDLQVGNLTSEWQQVLQGAQQEPKYVGTDLIRTGLQWTSYLNLRPISKLSGFRASGIFRCNFLWPLSLLNFKTLLFMSFPCQKPLNTLLRNQTTLCKTGRNPFLMLQSWDWAQMKALDLQMVNPTSEWR